MVFSRINEGSEHRDWTQDANYHLRLQVHALLVSCHDCASLGRRLATMKIAVGRFATVTTCNVIVSKECDTEEA